MKPNSHRINCLARQMLVKLGLKPDGTSLYSVQLMSWYASSNAGEAVSPGTLARIERLRDASMADAYRTLTALWEGTGDGALLADELLDRRPGEFAGALIDSLSASDFNDPRPRKTRKMPIGKRQAVSPDTSIGSGPLQ